MADYDDSFEADSTSTEVEEEEQAQHQQRGRAPLATSADSTTHNDSLPDESTVPPSATVPISVTSPPLQPPFAAMPVPAAPAAAVPAPLPVPLPVPVSELRVSTYPFDASGRSSSPSSPPLAQPRSRAGALRSPPTGDSLDTGKSTSGFSEGEMWRKQTTQSSGKLSNSDSVGLPREVAEAAARAEDKAEFQALSNFVAFGSARGSTATTTMTGQTSQRNSELHIPPAPSRVPRQFVAFPVSEDESSVQEQSHHGTPVKAASELQAAVSPQKSSSDTKSASIAPSSVFSTLSQHLQAPPPPLLSTVAPASAVPGRLSLPLPLAPPPVASPTAAAAAAAAAAQAAAAASVGPPTLSALSSAAVLSDTAAEAAASPWKGSATAGPASIASALPPLPSLPALPTPAWAAAPPLTHTTAGAVMSDATRETVAGHPQSPLRWAVEGGGASNPLSDRPVPLVAALPSAPTQRFPLSAEEARVSELREASEAVERLVRAFALLKGYGALDKGAKAAGGEAPVSVSAATTTAHRAGAAATVQARAASRSRGPRVPSAYGDARVQDRAQMRTRGAASPPLPLRTGSSRDGERLAEDLVFDCVLGLLHEHAGKPSKAQEDNAERKNGRSDDTSSPLPWRASRPHYEVVSADSFAAERQRGGGGAVAGRGRVTFDDTASSVSSPRGGRGSAFFGNADGVPGIDVPLFDPRDRHNATDLYNVAREALDKYVLRRVRTGDTSSSSPPPPTPATAPLRVTHITAVFAWALLLDMASVCSEIARSAYDAATASPSPIYPVLVEFRGDVACAEVARSAMHCLPFEVLSSGSSTTAQSSTTAEAHTCLFRMACWVTQEQLWTLTDALADTVREDMVRRAKAVQYAPFHTAAPSDVDPRLLVPSAVPMLTMRPLPNRRQGRTAAAATRPLVVDASTGASLGAGVFRDGGGGGGGERLAASRDHFDVPAAALQQAAYNISVLSTALLSSSTTDDMLADLRAEDYADVAVAVGDTINELLLDESIKAAVQRRAAEKVRKAQMQRTGYVSMTRQRKEQAIIDKAEREAEEMVQHILQEMRTQRVT